MEPTIAGKTAVVTGASSGIGRATAMALAREGARVALVARSEDRLRELAREIALVSRERRHSDWGADELMALVTPADVSDPESVEAMAAQVVDELGWPEILVNNAGTGHWSSFAETSPETVRKVMDVNFFGALHCTRAFLPAMLERGSGSLTFVSSGLGELPFPNTSIYCASKFAMHGFARSLRAEIEPLGIHVLVMMPGGTDTEFFDASVFPKEVLEEYLSQDLDPPEAVADRIVESIASRKRRATMSWTSDLGLRLSYLFPTLTALFLNRIGERLGKDEPVTSDDAGPTPEYSDLLQVENPDDLDRQAWERSPEEGAEFHDDEDR